MAEEQKHRRNQRSCVADADPPHEVGDVPSPINGLVQSPRADAGTEEVQNAPHTVHSDEA